MLAPALIPGAKTDKYPGPAEPALPNMFVGLCSEPLCCHIQVFGVHISLGTRTMWYIPRSKLPPHVDLCLILEAGTFPEMFLHKSAHIWNDVDWLFVRFCFPYNLRYFSLTKVVKLTVVTSLSPPAGLEQLVMLRLCATLQSTMYGGKASCWAKRWHQHHFISCFE